MTKHATALLAFTHADDSFAKGQTILNMDAGQFEDWSAPGVDLVRKATDAEVAKAKGDKAAAPAVKRPTAPKRVKAIKPPSKPATDPAPAAPVAPAEPSAA